ncbi:MAG TPA: DinB family protein, partial [Acidimicrobiales bacterium]
MDTSALLLDLYGRTPPIVAAAVEGLDADQLAWAPAPGANSVGWLVWHLTRVQDHHVSELLDDEQVWTTGEWA